MKETNIETALRLMTEQEVHALTGIALSTLRRWRSQRQQIPYVKVGGLAKYRPRDVAAFLDRQTVEVAP